MMVVGYNDQKQSVGKRKSKMYYIIHFTFVLKCMERMKQAQS